MPSSLEITLVIKPHHSYGRVYFIDEDENVMHQHSASEKDYLPDHPMGLDFVEGVKYQYEVLQAHKVSKIREWWKSFSPITVKELVDFDLSMGLGGTIYMLRVEAEGVEVSLKWIKVGSSPTPFDQLINILDG